MGASDFNGLPISLRVFELASGWRLEVDAGQDRTAELVAPDLPTALAMAMPFIEAVANPAPLPDALERLLRLPSAPDGPPDLGGRADG